MLMLRGQRNVIPRSLDQIYEVTSYINCVNTSCTYIKFILYYYYILFKLIYFQREGWSKGSLSHIPVTLRWYNPGSIRGKLFYFLSSFNIAEIGRLEGAVVDIRK